MNKAEAAIVEAELGQRTPPHSVEAEQGVLGSMLQTHDGSEAIAEASVKIDAEHFYVPAHRTIFTAIVDLFDAGQAIDLITFTQSLRDKNLLDAVGGAAFVTNLFSFVPTAAAIEYYLDIVRDKYILREAVAAGTELARRAYEEQENPQTVLDIIESKIDSIRSIHGRNGSDLPPPTNLVALAETDPSIFEIDNLLGNRFLCKEGGMLEIAPSGIGKSSAGVQQDVCWALGRAAFGIKPLRPLRILTIQAENDDGDLAEMARAICDHLNLTDEEKKLIGERVIYIKEKSKTGDAFLRLVRRLVRKYKPDIIRIDPLHAYVGGDVRDPAVTIPFLRNGLNPILAEFHCAAIIVHHTPKTTYRGDTADWNATDWAYAGAGNADVTNWARAILVIDATPLHGAFFFRAAKRGSRIGWADEKGSPVIERMFSWHGTSIYWRNATDEEIEMVQNSRRARSTVSSGTIEDLFNLIPPTGSIEKNVLLQRAAEGTRGDKRIGLNKARAYLTELIDEPRAFEWRIKRAKTNPRIEISRHEQTLV